METTLTKEITEQADKVHYIDDLSDLPFKNGSLPYQIAKANLEHKGFYGFTKEGVRVLFISREF